MVGSAPGFFACEDPGAGCAASVQELIGGLMVCSAQYWAGPEAEGWYVFHSVSHVQRNRQISLAD